MPSGRPERCVHVAVVDPRYAGPILAGEKTIEARFGQTRRAPYGRVHAGDRIYFKKRSAGYFAAAEVERVLTLSELNPDAVDDVRDAFGDRIGGTDEIWRQMRHRRYATLVTISGVTPTDEGPDLNRWVGSARRSGWHVLPAEAALKTGPAVSASR